MGKELGSRISETLQKRGMTQKELAGRIGVTEAVMSRYVSGDREPKPDVLANIATVDYIDGIKVLAPKDPKASISLPERSNTPGTAYASYRKDGTFDQYVVFDANRMPVYEIDYGVHDHVKSLHVHFYPNGERSKKPTILHPGDALYEKHKKLFKGVK